MSTSLFIVLLRNVSIDTLTVAASTSVKFFLSEIFTYTAA